MRIFLIIATLIVIHLGCNINPQSRNNINIKGCIIDEKTNKFIPFAKITILCWYDAGWEKTDYVSIDTTADKYGCFNTSFDEGYKIIIAATAQNYPPALKEYNEIKDKNIKVELRLKFGVNNYTNLHAPNFTLRKFILNNTEN